MRSIRSSMKLKTIFPFVLGGAALALSLFVYFEYIYMLGFPDGFITELGHAERKLAQIFIAASVIFASCFIYLGWMASRKEIRNRFTAGVLLYLVFMISIT